MIQGLKKTTMTIEKIHFIMQSVISRNLNSKLSIVATSFENLFRILPYVFFSKNTILVWSTLLTIVSCILLLMPMKTLIDINLPMNELSIETSIIATNTKLYCISYLSPSPSIGVLVNLCVNVNAKKRLTAMEQKFMMACSTKIRAMPPIPPQAQLKKSL